MSLRSVVTIDIDDTDFQRYAAAFAKYQEDLKGQPGLWAKVAGGAGSAATAAAEMGTAVGAAFFALHKISGEHTALTRGTQHQATAWRSMASSAGKFTSRVVEATRSLLRWGSLTGLISGILSGGGLFGIDRLAINASTQRQRAFQLSATPGEVAGADVDLARFTNPSTFMSNINRGLNDATSPAYLAMMNAGAHPDRQTDAATAAFDTILALKDSLDKIPKGPLFGTTAHNFKYDELMPMEDLIKMRNMSREEVGTQVARGREDAKKMELTPGQTKAWQELETQFARVSRTLQRDLIARLADLAPALEKLSGSFMHLVEVVLNNSHMQEWIDGIAHAIDRFASYIGGDKVGKDVDYVMGKIDDIFTGIGKVVAAIPGIVTGFESAIEAVKGFWNDPLGALKNGGVNGPLEDDNPKAPGSPAFNRQRHPERYTNEDKPDEPPEPMDWSGWRKSKWAPWNWGGGHQEEPDQQAPPRDVQLQAFKQLEGEKNLPSGLLDAVMKTESAGNVNAISPAGAVGPFQFMRATADRYGVKNRKDFGEASRGAASYLQDLLKEFRGEITKSVAGYNAGEGRVEQEVKNHHERWRDHVPPETQHYIDKILQAMQQNNPQPRSGPSFVPNSGRPNSVEINVRNQTGGNSYISASQLAV